LIFSWQDLSPMSAPGSADIGGAVWARRVAALSCGRRRFPASRRELALAPAAFKLIYGKKIDQYLAPDIIAKISSKNTQNVEIEVPNTQIRYQYSRRNHNPVTASPLPAGCRGRSGRAAASDVGVPADKAAREGGRCCIAGAAA
jgi:hypothetical protein